MSDITHTSGTKFTAFIGSCFFKSVLLYSHAHTVCTEH